MEYFIGAFLKNQGKIKTLIDNNPNIQLVTIDNSGNKNKECTHEEAVNWDYSVSDEQKYKLYNLINNDNGIKEERKQILLEGVPNLAGEAQSNNRGGQESDRRGIGSQVQGSQQRVGLNPKSTINPRFKQGIETLAGYYEGGGALLTHDYPGVTNELDDKLADHFMGGKELSDLLEYLPLKQGLRLVSGLILTSPLIILSALRVSSIKTRIKTGVLCIVCVLHLKLS